MIRRRRATALGVAVALLAVLSASLLLGLSGDHRSPSRRTGGSPVVLPGARPTHVRRARGQRPPRPFLPTPAAAALAASLSLERQVAQLFMVTVAGTSYSGLGGVDWGGVVLTNANFSSDAQISSLAGDLTAAARSAGHVAPLIAAPQEGGADTAFPDLPPEGQAAIGAAGDRAVARAQALLAGRRLKALGFNMTLAPVADVDTTGGALSGRLFGSDPGSVAQFTYAAVAGYAASRVISAVGHFPGTGSASTDPDQMTATVGGSLDALRARDLVPFAAVAPRVPVIEMSNALYAAFDGVTPAGLLHKAVDLLRREYRFEGVVMSDDLDAALGATGGDVGAAALAALHAGDDLLFVSGSAAEQRAAYDAVLAATRGDTSVRALVREALLRVLSLKARYGVLR
jgi:beta-N-acetylhexosaminidase